MVEITFEYFVKLTIENVVKSTTKLSHHDDRVVCQAFFECYLGFIEPTL
jgi:hypothetical protein